MAVGHENVVGKELWALLPVSPDSYPQKLDMVRGLALIIRLDAAGYRSASFLDDRILGPAAQGVWMALGRVTEAALAATGARPLHFVFHTGHVGSTLISRLIDQTGFVLPLREPLPLRTLADAHDLLQTPESLLDEAQFRALLDTFMRLWARGYEWTRAVVVKATSSAGRLAIPLLESRPQSRAICLNLRPEPYLATLLAGWNSAEDLRGHGPGRMRRLQARCGSPLVPLHRLSIGELAALGWLVETASQQDALRRFPGRVMAVDNEVFLASVSDEVERILDHFGLPADSGYLAGIGSSPVLQRYSKAPERPFSPEDRSRLLQDSRRANAAEIGRGMAWLEGIARSEPQLAEVLAGSAS